MSNDPIRVASAPITWGVCEVDGWGHQLDAGEVLAAMQEAGVRATELGPAGFLPADTGHAAELLAQHGLQLAGAFVAAVLHDERSWAETQASITSTCRQLRALDCSTLVLAAATGTDGYDTRAELSDRQWQVLLQTLDRCDVLAAEQGITCVVHPHVGTLVERPDDIERVLDGSAVQLCLDSGHMLIGGADPSAIAAQASTRIAHVHLKDVDAALAQRVRSGDVTYAQAVAQGLYVPLGDGAVDARGIVASLERAGYDGWYVLEQDRVLAEGGAVAASITDEVRRSIRVLEQARQVHA